MLKILEIGNKKTREQKRKETFFIRRCNNCGCRFLYQYEDIKEYYFNIDDWDIYVTCPQCNYQNTIFINRKYKKKVDD